MKRFFTLKPLLIFCFFLGSMSSEGQSIFSNTITATDPSFYNPFTTGQLYFPGITVSGIGRGTGILPSPTADRYNASVWNTPALNGTSYFEFILTPNAGYQINFISFVYHSQASGSGPNAFAFRSSLDGFTTDIGTPSVGGTTIDLTGVNYQGITSSITFRFYAWGASGVSETFSIDDFIFNGSVTPVSKFYRSISSGNWSNPAIWESSTDSATWVAASFPPAASDKHITIQAPYVVTVSSSISLDETTINGTLQVITGGVLNINNGNNDDITIPNNGVLQIVTTANYNLTIIPAPSSSVNVATGGKIQIGDGIVIVGTGYEGFASSLSNVWNDASTFEWNSSTPFKFGTNIIYFPNAGTAIPNFLITKITTTPIWVRGNS